MGVEGLQFQNVDVKFDDGLDTFTANKLVVPGKWLGLQNVTLARDGSFRRRDGVEVIGPTNGNALVLRDNQLASLNGAAGFSLTMDGKSAALPGRHGYVELSKEEAVRSQGMQDGMDVATNGTVTVYVWRDKSGSAAVQGVNVQVVDEKTGALLIPNTVMRATNGGLQPDQPHVVYCTNSSAFIIFYTYNSNLMARVVEAATPTVLGAETSLIASASLATGVSLDATFFNGVAAVYYGWADGLTSTRAIVVSNAGLVPAISQGPTNVTTEGALPVASISGLACAEYVSGGAFGCFVLSTGGGGLAGVAAITLNAVTFAVGAGPTRIDATVNPTAGPSHIACVAHPVFSRMTIFTDQQSNYGTARLNALRMMTIDSALGVTLAATTLINSSSFRVNGAEASGPQGPWIAGKPFVFNTSIFLPVCVQENFVSLGANVVTNNQQCTLFVLEASPSLGTTVGSAAALARCLTGTYGIATINGNAPAVSTVCSTPVIATSPASTTSTSARFAFLAPERNRLVLSGGLNVSPTGIARLTFAPRATTPPIKRQLGPVTHLAGGTLTDFDGAELVEASFHQYPEGVSCVANAVGGTVTAGVHQIVVVYEWIDGQGQRHQSAPSAAVSVTTAGATASVSVRIPTLMLQQRSNMSCVPYMTAAGGLTFYRCTLNAGVFAPLLNDTTVTNVLFTVTEADAALTSNEALYTQPNLAGATLPNTASPPCSALVAHQNRLWANVADDRGAFRYSQPLTAGTGLQWNDALGGRVDVNAGGIVAFAELDEKLIILCERKLYLVTGSGPSTGGLNSQYSEPIEIQSDAGCSEARSVLSMPLGVIYKSQKGWRLIGRDLAVTNIADGVQAYNWQNVTSAVLLEDRQECRFTSSESTAAQLIYCYRGNGQWAIAYLAGGAYGPTDAVWWPARYAATTSGATPGYGYVHTSLTEGFNGDSGSQTDATQNLFSSINKFLRSSWLKLNSIGGYQRARWLYLTMTCRAEGGAGGVIDSTLTVGLAFDDVELGNTSNVNYAVTVPMSTFATSALRATGIIDLRHKLEHQKCKSVQIVIGEDNAVTNSILGLQAVTLNVGVKRGTNKLPAAQGTG